MNWNRITDWIITETGILLEPGSSQAVGGGCINEAFLLTEKGRGRSVFVKVNEASRLDVFEAEVSGLKLLHATGTIRVPEPYAVGVVGDNAVLAMEGISLFSWQDAEHQAKLGAGLAALHGHTAADGKFGGAFDNHIGRTPQKNDPSDDWVEFFINHRLDYQFHLAAKNGWDFPERGELFSVVRARLNEIEPPQPSLLHGDLWGGNVAFDEQGEPVIFDPACYYGDREAEIAFTGMFGGFSAAFYKAYREVYPAPGDVDWRHRLYNLYHELNHFNLFGGGYRRQSEGTIRYLMGG